MKSGNKRFWWLDDDQPEPRQKAPRRSPTPVSRVRTPKEWFEAMRETVRLAGQELRD
jgi:hypothetical protein